MVDQRTPKLFWTKFICKCSIATVLVGLTDGCAEPPVFKHTPVTVLPMGSFQSGWFVDLDTKSDPVIRMDVREKRVFYYTEAKRVFAFDRKAGTLAFSVKVRSPDVHLLPAVELKDRIVFPNATSLEVYTDKGVFEESIPLNRPLRGDASGENETVYFGSVGEHGGLVEAYDVSNPVAPFKWEFLTHDTADVTAGTAVYAGTIFSASEGGEVDAVTTDRAQLWDTDHGAFLVSGSVTADLKADETGLYIASRDTKLYSVNRATGKLRWQYFAGVPLVDSPVTTVDTVYQYVPGQGLAAVDKILGAFNRSPRWVHPTATRFLAQDEKYSYLADPRPNPEDADHPLYAIIAVDKQTMKKVFESDRKDFNLVGSNRRDSVIYAGYSDGKMFAIKPVIKAGVIGELVMSPLLAPGSAHVD